VRHRLVIPDGLRQHVPVQMLLGITGVAREHERRRLAVPHPQRLMPGGMAVGRDEDQLAIAKDVVVAMRW
jgi:hypothetical protein